ncbi:class I SAM-dependent methyltransferase [Phenylobacterium sp.]|uniref:class I SAM-dependent methyltransferase n=1 Tax=Phenylobacterium sp. TaxID=1871053 RepID=UPI00374D0431
MTAATPPPCQLCGATDWRPLHDIQPDRSVRTDGGIVAVPLGKFQCAACGLAVRREAAEDPATLYADGYQLYANRPNADRFDPSRYRNLVGLLTRLWGEGTAPRRVLEAGCGDGALTEAMHRHWPQARVFGVEPSATAVALAQAQGFPVVQGMIGETVPPEVIEGGFDLIYSIHVVEHTPDPSVFLRDLAALLAPGGRLIVTCPDGATPHAELIHPDHLFSMTQTHLAAFARRAGLRVLAQGDCPGGAGAEFSQMLVCALGGDAVWTPMVADPAAKALFDARQAYLDLWRGLEAALIGPLADGEPLYCFGAGGWVANIAANCPALWDRVTACAIDGGADQSVQGKPVLDYASLRGGGRRFLAAVNPAIQGQIAQRLGNDGHSVLAWPEALSA